jgi:DNA processing protein
VSPAERRAWLRLTRAEGIGAITARLLIARHGSARAALAALPRIARGRAITVPDEAAAEAEERALARLGARLLVLDDPDYPRALAAIEDAPLALAVLGDPAQLARRSVAIVGARNASAGGRMLAERLARDLAEAGIVVVSGLARGIDAAAHEGALACGVTVAAVATGLDRPYPAEHAPLQARIAETGAVVAEAPLGTAALPQLFPRRNRIIAGLALGVVVVEAAPKSGSLITARLALEVGRELYAVPGSPLDPRARGANDLIRQGAHLVESAEDVLAHLPAGPPVELVRRTLPLAAPRAPDSEAHTEVTEPAEPPGDEVAAALAALRTLLSPAPVTVDELIRRCPCSAPAVSAALLELDLEGRIERLPGNRVALASR